MTKSAQNLCDTHIEMLIPWFVTNQLCEEEFATVQHHIDGCDDCAKLVEEERKIASLVQESDVNDIPSNWATFQQRLMSSDLDHSDSIGLEESDDIIPPPSNIIRFPLFNKAKTVISQPKTLGFIAAAQAAALIALISAPNIDTFSNIGDEDNQIYGTLSSAETAYGKGANTIMQFEPSLTLEEFNTLLISNNIEIVSGPTATDAYMVKISNDVTLESLRSNKNILLAEPISAE